MSQPAPAASQASVPVPRVLARASGVALVDRGDGKLHFVRYLHMASGLLAFALAAVALVLLPSLPLAVLGVVQVEIPLALHIALAAATVVALLLAVRHVRRRHAASLTLPAFCSIDPVSRMLTLDGQTVGPVVLFPAFQIASSSPRLVAHPRDGRIRVIVRGDPFLGGMRPLLAELRRQGLLY